MKSRAPAENYTGGAKPKRAPIFPSNGLPIFPKKYWLSEGSFYNA